MSVNTTIILASIGLMTLLAQWLAWRTRAPSIVFLLGLGILAGPITGFLDADQLLGDLLFPVVSLSVAVILFEGSLTLKFEELRDTGSTLWRMLTLGVLVTWVIIAWAVQTFVGLSWELSILFGAIMVVTGPTVIGPMLRSVRPNQTISRLLRWEGIVIDPLGAVLAILVFDVVLLAQQTDSLLTATVFALGEILAVGIIGGAAGGYLQGLVLRNYWLPQYLHNVGTLLVVLAVFVATNTLAHESGLIAVTVMGIWLANMRGVFTADILDFKESLSVLLISALFILLASRLDLGALASIGWPALAVFLIVQFVARPLKILVSSVPSDLTWRERGLLAWIAPRGIVAAAISALFALKLEDINYPGAELIVPLAFALIIGTVLWQGLTAPFIARLLGVASPAAHGVLFIGGNEVVRGIAERLHEAGFPVLVADSSWDNVRAARMAGLDTYFGNALSEHAERNMDLTGIGSMMAMSKRNDLNALGCVRFGHEFGRNGVYALPTVREKARSEKHTPAPRGGSRQALFGEDISYAKLASLLSSGAEFRQSPLTENFDYDALSESVPELIPLLAWDAEKQLQIRTDEGTFKPGPGWTVLSLVPVRPDAEAAAR